MKQFDQQVTGHTARPAFSCIVATYENEDVMKATVLNFDLFPIVSEPKLSDSMPSRLKFRGELDA